MEIKKKKKKKTGKLYGFFNPCKSDYRGYREIGKGLKSTSIRADPWILMIRRTMYALAVDKYTLFFSFHLFTTFFFNEVTG